MESASENAEEDRDARIAECRRRFRESGLPLFDEEFSAATNVFNRAAPLLALVFIGEMLGAISLDWSPAANVAALIGGESFEMTVELLKVAAGLAAFTGLYFAIAMLTDSTYRDEFLQEVTAELRSVFAVRADYLRLRSGPEQAD